MSLTNFEVISEIGEIEIIAVGRKIRELARLRRKYGPGRWRKLKGAVEAKAVSGLSHETKETCGEVRGMRQQSGLRSLFRAS